MTSQHIEKETSPMSTATQPQSPTVKETIRHCLQRFRPEAVCYMHEISSHERPAPNLDLLASYILGAHRASAHRLTGQHHATHRHATLDTLKGAALALAIETIAGQNELQAQEEAAVAAYVAAQTEDENAAAAGCYSLRHQ